MLLARPHGPLVAYLRGLTGNSVALNSVYMMGSQVASVLLQTGQFLLVARALGSHEFGIVASILAITSVLLPFSSLCLGNVAIIRIARGQASAHTLWGNGLVVTLGTAVIGVPLALLLGKLLLSGDGVLRLVLFFAVSELLLTKSIDVIVHIFMAREQHGVGACLLNLQLFVRLACATALWWGWVPPTALAWAELHLTAGLLSTVLVCWAAVRLIGVPRVNIQSALHDMKTGVFFSIGTAAANLQTDVDKVILAREESSGTAGAYTAAFRLVYMSFIPVLAIVYAVRSRLFRKGQHGGMTGVLDAVRGVVPVAGGYIVVAVAVIYLAAPAVPWLLGPSYQLSSHVLQLLCVLPVLLAIRAVCAEALVGADGHRRLSYLNVVSACLCLALNLTLVRLYGWRGAVAAAYATQSFMVIALLISIAQRRSAERRATA